MEILIPALKRNLWLCLEQRQKLWERTAFLSAMVLMYVPAGSVL